MSIDECIRLIEALTKLLAILIWPVLVFFVLLRFGPAIREFFASLGEFSLKAAGFEASAKRIKAEATAALASAVASRPEPGTTPEESAREARAAISVVAETVTPQVIRHAGRSTILWVDDIPSNNKHERQALEALGVSFVLSTSTEDALERLRTRSFDVIISDMGRPPDPQAGYTLLDKIRASGDKTPFIIYAGSRAPEHQAEARRRGALGCTNRPSELFEMVLSALRRKSWENE
jgi:CheY-like chemotaxis protein